MDNFDLKQFLVKNKLTENSRLGEIKTTPGNTGTTRFVDLKVGDIITPKMWDKQKFKGNFTSMFAISSIQSFVQQRFFKHIAYSAK